MSYEDKKYIPYNINSVYGNKLKIKNKTKNFFFIFFVCFAYSFISLIMVCFLLSFVSKIMIKILLKDNTKKKLSSLSFYY